MRDFIFVNPVKIVFGRGRAKQVGELLKPFGKKTMFVFGKESIKKSGLYGVIRESLEAGGITLVEHGGVKPNPVLSHTREGVEKAKAENIDSVLAVGGGSVMDEAKAIAAGVKAQGDVWEIFSKAKRPDAALPVITVPTLAATGSEMNANAVVTNEETSEKLGMYIPAAFPKVSVLDPTLTLTVPKDHTAYGIVDIFSHIIEPYFNSSDPDAPIQDNLAEGLMVSLTGISERLMENLEDYNARAEMMWASSLALHGFLAAGRGTAKWECHILAHTIGALFDAAHGASLSVIIPGWMDYAWNRDPEKFARFAVKVMGVDGNLNNAKAVLRGIEKVREWFSDIGAPVSLEDIGVTKKDIPALVENVYPIAQQSGMDDFTKETITSVYTSCL